jgi:drug/metabolite transporter (DMT)-like permease
VIAILGGLGAAASWAVATLCSSRTSRMIGSWSTLAWVMLVGLAVTIPLLAAAGLPPGLDWAAGGWLALAGIGNVAGLLFVYEGLKIGKVGIVAPIASTEGAIAAVIAVLAGEAIGAAAGATLVLIVAGVVLAGIAPDSASGAARTNGRAALFGAAAAVSFGVGLYAAGRVASELPIAWVLLPTRLLAVVAVAVPLLVRRRLRVTRAALPLAVLAGLAEVAGIACFTIGAREGIAVSVVIASLYAAVAAVAAFALFRERLTPIQVGGVAAIVLGVAALSVLQA